MNKVIIEAGKALIWMFTGAVVLSVVMYQSNDVHNLYLTNREELAKIRA